MATENLVPDGIVDVSNFNPTPTDVTNIDEGSTPDGNWWISNGNNVSPNTRLTMQTPSGRPDTGAGLQSIWAYLREFDSGQSGTASVTIRIYRAGDPDNSPTHTSSSINVTSATGEWVEFAFDYSGFTGAADGSDLEVDIDITKSGGGPSARQSLDLGAVYWECQYTAGKRYRYY